MCMYANYIEIPQWSKDAKAARTSKDFKTWYESNFQYLPPEVIAQFDVIREKFVSDQNSIKMAHQYHSKFPLGTISIEGRKIKVLAGYDIRRAHYDRNTEKIFIPYNDPETMEHDFLHELGHTIDQKYKSPTWPGESPQHQNNLNPQTDAEKTAYAKEPVEFDAMGTHIAHIIEMDFDHSNDVTKRRIINDLTNWLKRGGNLPYISPDMINKWKTKPTLWKKLQSRIWNLVQRLQQKSSQS